MHRVIVVGSPRADGRSASLANELFNACIEECPQDGVSIVSVASIEVGPCRGCDACRIATEAPDKLPEDDDNLAICPEVAKSDALVHRCVIHDDMTEVRKHLDAADELIVVSPVYFAGPPAQFKCLIDRLQPYFWSNVRLGAKRPCVLHVVGEGGDPHGFEPLVGCVRSAFSCAGFELELVLDWVGKIDENGEITAEAEEYVLSPTDSFTGNWEDDESAAEAGAASAREAAEVDRASVRGLVEPAESDAREGAEPVEAGAASAQRDAEAASGRAVGGFASSGEAASGGEVAPGDKLASNGEPAPGEGIVPGEGIASSEGIAPRPRARLSFAGIGGADAGDFRGSRDSKGSGSSKGGSTKDARGSKGSSAKSSGSGSPKGSKSGKGGSAKGNATRGGSPKGGGKGGSNAKRTSSGAGRNGSQGSKGGTPKGGSSKGGTHRGSSAARQNAKGSGRRGRR